MHWTAPVLVEFEIAQRCRDRLQVVSAFAKEAGLPRIDVEMGLKRAVRDSPK
ncbi:hypothetical protein [Streptomyces siamensis]|uniref:Uncharacterized protein n=1 Tax=Streptomyces siamensis TaxID=1274986 RepID=A0ABP9J867_9ACTN